MGEGNERPHERLTKVEGAVDAEVGTHPVHVVALDQRRVVNLVEGLAGLGHVVRRVPDLGVLSAWVDLIVAADRMVPQQQRS